MIIFCLEKEYTKMISVINEKDILEVKAYKDASGYVHFYMFGEDLPTIYGNDGFVITKDGSGEF